MFSLIVGFAISSTSVASADPAPATPDAPSALVAYRGHNSAEVAFTAGADGGAAITNYKYSTDNGSSWIAFSPAVTSSPVTIGGLTNGTTYNIKLRAVNSVGDGAVSDAVSVTPAVVDAVTWTAPTAAAANGWTSVTQGNGVFVAVAQSGSNRVMTSADGVTWTARSAAEELSWQSVTYGNGVFVAVASDGSNQVMTSADGVTWTARSAAEENNWNSVTYGNGVFVAVAQSGSNQVMTSTDGVTWTARSAAEANYWYSVTYGNGVFVAVAPAGTDRVMTSADGVTWTARSAAEANQWFSVTYGNGVFVALSGNGANRVMTSTDGVTWTARSAAEASSWKSVTYGNGVFVAVSSSWTNRVMTSTDGVTWTKRTTAESGTWNSVTYGTGVFVAIGSLGSNRVMTSSLVQLAAPAAPTSLVAYRGNNSAEIAFTAGADGGAAITNYKYSTDNGSSWNAFSPAVTSSSVTIGGLTNGMTYNIKLRAVNAIGDGAVSDAVAVTPAVVNAITWTARTAAAASNWRSVAYGNGVFVAVAGGGTNRVMTSTDGVTWTARTAAAASWNSVTYGNGVFVAVAYSGWDRVMTSADGVTWTARTASDANTWYSVTYGNGLFVAVAYSGSSRVMTSPDGVTWTARTAAAESGWDSVTYGNGLFVAVANSGSSRVMTSPDGVTWTAQTAAEANFWDSVTYGNGLFVAVASDGSSRVMTSADGVTWTARSAAEESQWISVTYGNGVFVAVASWGTTQVMISTNGVTWTARSAAEANEWRSVTYGNGVFVAVSRDGSNRVMTSSLAEPAAPSAPTSLVATAGVNSASIAFTAGDNGGAAITKYQYKVGSGSWTDAVGTSSPITVSGLTNYQTSTVRLRVVNAVGNSVASSPVSVTPRQAGPAVTAATPSGRTGIAVTFSLNPLPGTTVAYQSVVAYVQGTNTVAGTCRTYARQTTCYISGLTRATNYDLRVTAHLPVVGKSWRNTTSEGSILQVSTNN